MAKENQPGASPDTPLNETAGAGETPPAPAVGLPPAPSAAPAEPEAEEEFDLEARLRSMKPQQLLKGTIKWWGDHHKAPVLALWLRDEDSIQRETAEEVFRALKSLPPHTKELWVMLNSSGGNLHGAYAIARRLQESAAVVHAVIPRWAKSAATLITLGCHDVVMHPMAELGPIDTQTVVVRDDTKRSLSTLDALKSLEYLRRYAVDSFLAVTTGMQEIRAELTVKAASTIGASVMKGLVDPLFSRIDPIQMGEVFRALDLSREYARRLMAVSYFQMDEGMRDRLVEQVAENYPAHGFVIDFREAERLGLKVRLADGFETSMLDIGVEYGAGRARAVTLYLPTAEQAEPGST